jgi:exodeoxyribonuclease-3
VAALSIATWNVNSLRVRLPQLRDWAGGAVPDVLALQETKLTDPEFPVAELRELGYLSAFAGQRTYNGVAVLVRAPLLEGGVLAADATEIPGFADPQRRVLAVTLVLPGGALRLIDLYVPNGQAVGSEKYAYKLEWFAALRRWLRAEAAAHARLVVLGDFNVAPEDRDVHDPKSWEGSVHVSEPERAALRALFDDGFVDVFRRFEQPARSYSWWDYRAGAFRRDHGLRIDLILASAALATRCTGCRPLTYEPGAAAANREPRPTAIGGEPPDCDTDAESATQRLRRHEHSAG